MISQRRLPGTAGDAITEGKTIMGLLKIDGECTVCGGQNGSHYPWCGHAS